MARFNNFTTLITNNNSNDNDNDDEEEKGNDNEFERDNIEEKIGEDEDKAQHKQKSPAKVEVGHIPEPEPLKEEFMDNSYWRVEHMNSVSIDDLLEEMKYE